MKKFFPYALVAFLIGARMSPTLFRAEFWAEDATEFFQTAISLGWKSLAAPVYGYHFVLSRLIAYIPTHLPVLWTPYFYAWSCLAVNVLSIGYFSRDGFSWLVPSSNHRIIICALLVAAPGAAEVTMNLCNLTSSLGLLALMLLLEKPHALSWKKFAALIFIALSSGHVVVLLPLIFFLWYRSKNSRYLYLIAALVPIFALNIFGNHASGAKTGYLDYSKFFMVPRVVLENYVLRLFFAPFLGDRLTGEFMTTSEWVFWPIALFVTCGGLYLFWRSKLSKEKKELLLLSYLLVIGTFGIIAVSRSYAVKDIQRYNGNLLWEVRYSFLPGIVANLMWFSLFFDWLGRAPKRGRLAVIGLAGLLLVSGHNISRWKNIYWRPNLHWPEDAARIQEALDRRKAGLLEEAVRIHDVRLHPVGTNFERQAIVVKASHSPEH